MRRKSGENTSSKEHIEALAREYLERMQRGENITITSILEELLTHLW